MKQEIKAIVFDIGGVMAMEKNLKEHYPPLCKALKIDYKKFLKLRDKWINKASSGIITGKQLIQIYSKEFKIDYKKFLYNWIKYKRKSVKKNKKLEKIIIKLKKEGYIIASLSNVLDLHYKIGMEKGIYTCFKFNISSFKVGCRKPEARIYRILINKLKIPPREIVFIDDHQSCLNGAKKLGIKTILFKNNNQLIRDLKKLGVKI